jgi:hypothetical protein
MQPVLLQSKKRLRHLLERPTALTHLTH